MPPIALSEYDPAWPRRYGEEAVRVREALGDSLVAVEHMGSTAVPGLAGKPVIDLSAGLRTMDLAKDEIAAMKQLGYEYLGEHGLPGRLFFQRPTHHVHAVEWNGTHWHRHLAFRDYLRAHPDEACAYAAFKRRIAPMATDSTDYWERKQQFVDGLFERAWRWYERARLDEDGHRDG